MIPLIFLGVAVTLNVFLDLLFVPVLHGGVGAAAWATMISQYLSAAGLHVYYRVRLQRLHPEPGGADLGCRYLAFDSDWMFSGRHDRLVVLPEKKERIRQMVI